MMTRLAALGVLLSLTAAAELPLGKVPKTVSLAGDRGGRLDGTAWSSTEMPGKITVLFYVDPDEKDLNEPFAEALRKEEFPGEKFASVAVINLGATWKPNWVIDKILAGKQKKYPRTIYVRDTKKALVTEWQLADDNYDVVVFDRDGAVLFSKDGKFTDADITKVVEMIKGRM